MPRVIKRQQATVSHRPASLFAIMVMVLAMPAGGDNRHAYGPKAPSWLRAVGKLEVPGSKAFEGHRRYHREDCSATLVAGANARQADTIVTAWHCLEFYNDLSRPITFTLLPGRPGTIATEARRLADGGGMHADWALLRLQRPVRSSEVTAMLVNPQRADPGRPITMAGYSRDAGKGNNGDTLTFDPDCQITLQGHASSDTDCNAYKGASGGAVVQTTAQGQFMLSGVISRGDGAGTSIYIPVERFRGAINRYLN